jgi:hypothetical protein
MIEQKNKETCVLCRCIVDVDVSTPIDFRDFYVEGAGQMCQPCFEKTYKDEKLES